MGNYEPDRDSVKRGSSDHASDRVQAERRRKRQISAVLERKGEHDLARRICTCQSIKMGGYPCGKVWACEFCAWVSAKRDRYERAARALIARERNPQLSFTFVTLTAAPQADLRTAIRDLSDRISKLLRSRSGSWSKVRGMQWWIEPQRGKGGRYRPHVHAIVAFDALDAPRHPRTLVLRWARRVWRDAATALGRTEYDEREFLALCKQLQIKPLRCYPNSYDPLPPHPAFRITSDCDPRLLPFDLMNVSEYSRRDERLKHRERHDGHPSLTAEDRAELTLVGSELRLRGTTGVFRGVNGFDLDDLIAQLRDLDALSQRRKGDTQPLKAPEDDHTLVPRTGCKTTETVEFQR